MPRTVFQQPVAAIDTVREVLGVAMTVRVGTCAWRTPARWVDDMPWANWPGGPASHRSAAGSSGDIALAAGEHERVIALARPGEETAELLLLVSDPTTHKWLPWALARKV